MEEISFLRNKEFAISLLILKRQDNEKSVPD
jgi:hypothetical protein